MSRLIPIVSVLFLILLILGGYFLWLPEYQRFAELRSKLAIKDEEIRQEAEYLSELNTLSDKLAGYKDAISKIDSALPTDPSIAALFNFLQKASSENGLILKSHNLGELYSLEITEGGVQKMPFSISLLGSLPAFKNFLSSIYKNIRIIEVESISFSSSGGEELLKKIFTFNLSLKTHGYYIY